MGEYDFGKAVKGLKMSLLWAKDGIAWDEYPNTVFNQKRYHEYMEKGVFFQVSDDIKENLEWVFSHDFDIWAVAVSAVHGYKKKLSEVVTADQVKRHLDNPLLFELPERETQLVSAFIECREALRWLYEIRKVRKKTKAAPAEQAEESAVIGGAADRLEPDAFAELLKNGQWGKRTLMQSKLDEVKEKHGIKRRRPALRKIIEEYQAFFDERGEDPKKNLSWLEDRYKKAEIK